MISLPKFVSQWIFDSLSSVFILKSSLETFDFGLSSGTIILRDVSLDCNSLGVIKPGVVLKSGIVKVIQLRLSISSCPIQISFSGFEIEIDISGSSKLDKREHFQKYIREYIDKLMIKASSSSIGGNSKMMAYIGGLTEVNIQDTSFRFSNKLISSRSEVHIGSIRIMEPIEDKNHDQMFLRKCVNVSDVRLCIDTSESNKDVLNLPDISAIIGLDLETDNSSTSPNDLAVSLSLTLASSSMRLERLARQRFSEFYSSILPIVSFRPIAPDFTPLMNPRLWWMFAIASVLWTRNGRLPLSYHLKLLVKLVGLVKRKNAYRHEIESVQHALGVPSSCIIMGLLNNRSNSDQFAEEDNDEFFDAIGEPMDFTAALNSLATSKSSEAESTWSLWSRKLLSLPAISFSSQGNFVNLPTVWNATLSFPNLEFEFVETDSINLVTGGILQFRKLPLDIWTLSLGISMFSLRDSTSFISLPISDAHNESLAIKATSHNNFQLNLSSLHAKVTSSFVVSILELTNFRHLATISCLNNELENDLIEIEIRLDQLSASVSGMDRLDVSCIDIQLSGKTSIIQTSLHCTQINVCDNYGTYEVGIALISVKIDEVVDCALSTTIRKMLSHMVTNPRESTTANLSSKRKMLLENVDVCVCQYDGNVLDFKSVGLVYGTSCPQINMAVDSVHALSVSFGVNKIVVLSLSSLTQSEALTITRSSSLDCRFENIEMSVSKDILVLLNLSLNIMRSVQSSIVASKNQSAVDILVSISTMSLLFPSVTTPNGVVPYLLCVCRNFQYSVVTSITSSIIDESVFSMDSLSISSLDSIRNYRQTVQLNSGARRIVAKLQGSAENSIDYCLKVVSSRLLLNYVQDETLEWMTYYFNELLPLLVQAYRSCNVNSNEVKQDKETFRFCGVSLLCLDALIDIRDPFFSPLFVQFSLINCDIAYSLACSMKPCPVVHVTCSGLSGKCSDGTFDNNVIAVCRTCTCNIEIGSNIVDGQNRTMVTLQACFPSPILTLTPESVGLLHHILLSNILGCPPRIMLYSSFPSGPCTLYNASIEFPELESKSPSSRGNQLAESLSVFLSRSLNGSSELSVSLNHVDFEYHRILSSFLKYSYLTSDRCPVCHVITCSSFSATGVQVLIEDCKVASTSYFDTLGRLRLLRGEEIDRHFSSCFNAKTPLLASNAFQIQLNLSKMALCFQLPELMFFGDMEIHLDYSDGLICCAKNLDMHLTTDQRESLVKCQIPWLLFKLDTGLTLTINEAKLDSVSIWFDRTCDFLAGNLVLFRGGKTGSNTVQLSVKAISNCQLELITLYGDSDRRLAALGTNISIVKTEDCPVSIVAGIRLLGANQQFLANVPTCRAEFDSNGPSIRVFVQKLEILPTSDTVLLALKLYRCFSRTMSAFSTSVTPPNKSQFCLMFQIDNTLFEVGCLGDKISGMADNIAVTCKNGLSFQLGNIHGFTGGSQSINIIPRMSDRISINIVGNNVFVTPFVSSFTFDLLTMYNIVQLFVGDEACKVQLLALLNFSERKLFVRNGFPKLDICVESLGDVSFDFLEKKFRIQEISTEQSVVARFKVTNDGIAAPLALLSTTIDCNECKIDGCLEYQAMPTLISLLQSCRFLLQYVSFGDNSSPSITSNSLSFPSLPFRNIKLCLQLRHNDANGVPSLLQLNIHRIGWNECEASISDIGLVLKSSDHLTSVASFNSSQPDAVSINIVRSNNGTVQYCILLRELCISISAKIVNFLSDLASSFTTMTESCMVNDSRPVDKLLVESNLTSSQAQIDCQQITILIIPRDDSNSLLTLSSKLSVNLELSESQFDQFRSTSISVCLTNLKATTGSTSSNQLAWLPTVNFAYCMQHKAEILPVYQVKICCPEAQVDFSGFNILLVKSFMSQVATACSQLLNSHRTVQVEVIILSSDLGLVFEQKIGQGPIRVLSSRVNGIHFGDRLTKLNEEDSDGSLLTDIVEIIRNSPRPMYMSFERCNQDKKASLTKSLDVRRVSVRQMLELQVSRGVYGDHAVVCRSDRLGIFFRGDVIVGVGKSTEILTFETLRSLLSSLPPESSIIVRCKRLEDFVSKAFAEAQINKITLSFRREESKLPSQFLRFVAEEIYVGRLFVGEDGKDLKSTNLHRGQLRLAVSGLNRTNNSWEPIVEPVNVITEVAQHMETNLWGLWTKLASPIKINASFALLAGFAQDFSNFWSSSECSSDMAVNGDHGKHSHRVFNSLHVDVAIVLSSNDQSSLLGTIKVRPNEAIDFTPSATDFCLTMQIDGCRIISIPSSTVNGVRVLHCKVKNRRSLLTSEKYISIIWRSCYSDGTMSYQVEPSWKMVNLCGFSLDLHFLPSSQSAEKSCVVLANSALNLHEFSSNSVNITLIAEDDIEKSQVSDHDGWKGVVGTSRGALLVKRLSTLKDCDLFLSGKILTAVGGDSVYSNLLVFLPPVVVSCLFPFSVEFSVTDGLKSCDGRLDSGHPQFCYLQELRANVFLRIRTYCHNWSETVAIERQRLKPGAVIRYSSSCRDSLDRLESFWVECCEESVGYLNIRILTDYTIQNHTGLPLMIAEVVSRDGIDKFKPPPRQFDTFEDIIFELRKHDGPPLMWIDSDGRPCTTPDMFQLPSSDWIWFSEWCNKREFVQISLSSIDEVIRRQLVDGSDLRLRKRQWSRYRVRKSYISRSDAIPFQPRNSSRRHEAGYRVAVRCIGTDWSTPIPIGVWESVVSIVLPVVEDEGGYHSVQNIANLHADVVARDIDLKVDLFVPDRVKLYIGSSIRFLDLICDLNLSENGTNIVLRPRQVLRNFSTYRIGFQSYQGIEGMNLDSFLVVEPKGACPVHLSSSPAHHPRSIQFCVVGPSNERKFEWSGELDFEDIAETFIMLRARESMGMMCLDEHADEIRIVFRVRVCLSQGFAGARKYESLPSAFYVDIFEDKGSSFPLLQVLNFLPLPIYIQQNHQRRESDSSMDYGHKIILIARNTTSPISLGLDYPNEPPLFAVSSNLPKLQSIGMSNRKFALRPNDSACYYAASDLSFLPEQKFPDRIADCPLLIMTDETSSLALLDFDEIMKEMKGSKLNSYDIILSMCATQDSNLIIVSLRIMYIGNGLVLKFDQVSQAIPRLATTRRELTTDGLQGLKNSTSCRFECPGIIVSIVDKIPKEIFVLSSEEFSVSASWSDMQVSLFVKFRAIQLDCYEAQCRFPVILRFSAKKDNLEKLIDSSETMEDSNENIDDLLRLKLTCSRKSEASGQFEPLQVQLCKLVFPYKIHLCLDDPAYRSFLHLFQLVEDFVKLTAKPKLSNSSSSGILVHSVKLFQMDEEIVSEVIQESQSRTLLLHFFQTSICRIDVSMNPLRSESHVERWTSSSAIMRILFELAMWLENANLKLRHLQLVNQLLSVSQLQSILSQHYVEEIRNKSFRLVGSMHAVGNPFGLLRGFKQGARDFVTEPLNGLLQTLDEVNPTFFVTGVARGTTSLLRHSVGGVAESASLMTDTFSRQLTHLTLSEEDKQKRNASTSNKPDGLFDGIRTGGMKVIGGVFDGVTGVVSKPIEGGKESGFGGMLVGMGRGLIGLAVKPIIGISDAATSVLRGVTGTTVGLVATVTIRQYRQQRPMYSDLRILQEYNQDDAEAWSILKSMGFDDDEFCFLQDIGQERAVIVTEQSNDSHSSNILWCDITSIRSDKSSISLIFNRQSRDKSTSESEQRIRVPDEMLATKLSNQFVQFVQKSRQADVGSDLE